MRQTAIDCQTGLALWRESTAIACGIRDAPPFAFILMAVISNYFNLNIYNTYVFL